MKNCDIHEIEALTEDEARKLAIDTEVVKGHQIYFADLGEFFGYSCLVFKNGHHIYYANDYELHHRHRDSDELKAYYMDKLNRILFTEEEIGEPLHDYDEYTRRDCFVRNYYIQQVDHLSCFGIHETKEEKAAYERQKAEMYMDPIAFAYVKDKAFVKKHMSLFNSLIAAKEKMTCDYDYQKKAFLSEMYNHEYGINWQADYDTLSAFGNIAYARKEESELDSYFEQLNFNNVQKKAYLDARAEYYKKTGM